MKKLMLIIILLALSTTLNASELSVCKERLVYQEIYVVGIENKNTRLEVENARFQERERQSYIFRIPFTTIGISTQFGQGTIFGGFLVVLLL